MTKSVFVLMGRITNIKPYNDKNIKPLNKIIKKLSKKYKSYLSSKFELKYLKFNEFQLMIKDEKLLFDIVNDLEKEFSSFNFKCVYAFGHGKVVGDFFYKPKYCFNTLGLVLAEVSDLVSIDNKIKYRIYISKNKKKEKEKRLKKVFKKIKKDIG